MRGLNRFVALGFADADARVGKFLTARSSSAADRYLSTSAVVRVLNKATYLLRDWWQASATGRTLQTITGEWQRQNWAARYEAVAVALLAAAAVHVVLTVISGPRPGWFWLILPALAAAVGIVIIAGSRTSTSP